MARDYVIPIDLHNLEIRRAVAHLLTAAPGSPVEGLFFWNTTTHVIEFWNGTSWLVFGTLDQINKAAADVDINSHKLLNVSNGTAATDAVNKGQLDGAIAGVSWKAAVRAATTVAGTLATAFANGQTIDGVALVTGDRILIKNQAAPADNGIYTVNAAGAPTRAVDADAAAELLNAAVFVEEGTTNADSGWVGSANAPIVVGTTALPFVQFNAASLSAGAGLTLTGSVLDVVAGAAPSSGGPGGGLVVAADSIAIDTNVVVRKFSTDIGDGATTSIVVTHNLGTVDVHVAVADKTTPFGEVYPEVRRTSTNTVTLVFAVAPTAAQYRATVHA